MLVLRVTKKDGTQALRMLLLICDRWIQFHKFFMTFRFKMDVIDKEAESVYEVFSEYGDYLIAVRILIEILFCCIPSNKMYLKGMKPMIIIEA